jgi:hypothetical protein
MVVVTNKEIWKWATEPQGCPVNQSQLHLLKACQVLSTISRCHTEIHRKWQSWMSPEEHLKSRRWDSTIKCLYIHKYIIWPLLIVPLTLSFFHSMCHNPQYGVYLFVFPWAGISPEWDSASIPITYGCCSGSLPLEYKFQINRDHVYLIHHCNFLAMQNVPSRF